MNNEIVSSMVKLAKENLIYLSYGEWDGSPSDLDDLSVDFLVNMKTLCELAMIAKAKESK